jgi:hypothetical protein
MTVSDNFSFLAHAELMTLCDALESYRIMIGCQNSNNVLVSTSSPSRISSTMVWLTQPLLGIGALNWPLC